MYGNTSRGPWQSVLTPYSPRCSILSVRKLQSGPLICIANVHIFSNPKFPDVKLWQSNMVVKQVCILAATVQRLVLLIAEAVADCLRRASIRSFQIEQVALTRNLPTILCGDFNSEPTSAVYQLMTRNQVSLDHPDVRHAPMDLVSIYATLSLEHNMLFGSAYASVFGSEPEYTNYTGERTTEVPAPRRLRIPNRVLLLAMQDDGRASWTTCGTPTSC